MKFHVVGTKTKIFTVLNNKTIFKTQGQELLKKKKKQKTYHKVCKTKKKKGNQTISKLKTPK